MTRHVARRGFTLFELIVVMALLLLLAAVILPSIGAFRGDTRQRAAADAFRSELSVARARAMEENRPYRVAISENGKRVRRAPDTAEFAQTPAFAHSDSTAPAVDFELEHVTAEATTESDLKPESVEGWVTVATLLPDGSCREDGVTVVLTEVNNGSMRVRVRGVTGSSRVVPNTGAK